ncbi:MAG: hypothetical protein ACJ76B_07920 [Solirubrobacterales bacterium]
MSHIEISPEHRDILYLSITARLTGVNDIYVEFERGNFEAAQRLSGEFSDDLRVLHDDLGWGETPLESIQLTAPHDVWERTLARIQKRAAERHEERTLELGEERQRIQAIEDTCATLAERLSGSE